MNFNRVPEGVPTGGQFAAVHRAESNLSLVTSNEQSWTADEAVVALDDVWEGRMQASDPEISAMLDAADTLKIDRQRQWWNGPTVDAADASRWDAAMDAAPARDLAVLGIARAA